MKMITGYRRLWILVLFMAAGVAFAQTDPSAANNTTQTVAPSVAPASAEVLSVPAETAAEEEVSAKPQTITLDFKEADIRDVLKIISYKSGVNIVSAPEVAGTVNVRISDVPWERALDVILKTYGYAYDKQDNIIMVAPLEKLTAQRKMEQDLAQVQPTRTDVFDLKYIDALDAKKAIEPQLSPRGRITILEVTGQAGWASLGSGSGTRAARGGEITSRSKTLIVSDVPPVLDKIKEVVESIDVKIKQILIETRIVEVNLNKLKDIGFDYGTGGPGSSVQTGAGFQAQNTTLTYDENGNVTGTVTTPAINQSPTVESVTDSINAGGSSLGNIVTPAAFLSQAGGLTSLNTGLRLLFQKLEGTQFEILFHALEENVASNTLSAPTVLTLNNLEAYIIVGEKFPIVESTASTNNSQTIGTTLKEWKDIGIQLNVVPQISGKNKDYINMIIHPAVTTRGSMVGNYPIIATREAQTQVLIKSGETIMIGGLIKDIKIDSKQGVPFLRKIPFVGKIFERDTGHTEKVELIIFITAHIVDDKALSPEQLEALESDLGLRVSGK